MTDASAMDRRKEIVRRFVQEVWSDGDADAADAYVSRRYTIRHDPGDPWDGRTLDLEGFKDRVRRSREPFPDQRFTIDALVADADRVVATWLWTGTHMGDFPGFPASGRHITMSGITLYDFDGERLSGHWQVSDRLAVYQQLSR